MPKGKVRYVDFQAVKATVSIVQILDHYGLTASFKPNGKGDSLSGPCPLHGGHNPTQFRVSIEKNCWHCFSECHHGGNILDFVAYKEDCSIRESAILISDWFEVAPPDLPVASGSNSNQERSTAKVSSKKVAADTQADVSESAPSLPNPIEPNKPLGFQLKIETDHPYLTERGLTPETISHFGVGFCVKGSMANRIVIPVHNAVGALVAYAGRWPGDPPDDTPKYKLPAGFGKSLEVFNLQRASTESQETPLIVVEGFFDCMKVWQAGVRRVVALMGSSLSQPQEEQIAQLVGTGGQIGLMLDYDEAGISAREQALRRFASRAYVRVIELRNFGKQPDELSTEQLQEVILHDDVSDYVSAAAKFSPGQLVATPNALRSLDEVDIRAGLNRHLRGDWGDLDDEDIAENELSLVKGFRLLSAYKAANGTKFWIITEADRSATTVLLPADY